MGIAPNLRSMSVVAKRVDHWMDQNATCLGREASAVVTLSRDPAPVPPRGTAPNFRFMSIMAKRPPISATAEHLLTTCLPIFLVLFLLIILHGEWVQVFCTSVPHRAVITCDSTTFLLLYSSDMWALRCFIPASTSRDARSTSDD